MLVSTITFKLHIQYAITNSQENNEELELDEPLTDAYKKVPNIRRTCYVQLKHIKTTKHTAQY